MHLVTVKHVNAAIQDSEFGRNAGNLKQYFSSKSTLLAIMAIGLLAALLAYAWKQSSQNQAPANATSFNQSAQIEPQQSNLQKVPVINTGTGAPTTTLTPVDAKQQMVNSRLEATNQWLKNGSPNTITLQIMTSSEESQLKNELEVLSRQLELDKLYLFRKKQNNANLNVFLYGAFSERSEALAALQSMPVQIKNNHPQLRTLAGINKELEQSQ